MLKDFKAFIARGNVLDLAVGIIIGAAFTSIVKSLVDDIVMPVAGIFTGGVDFSDLYINLSQHEYESLKAAKDAGAATLNYGLFINAVIHFLIVSFAIYLMVKAFTAMKAKAVDPKDTSLPIPQDIQLLTEIRDLLAAKKK